VKSRSSKRDCPFSSVYKRTYLTARGCYSREAERTTDLPERVGG
jgi:hypothetical protein